MTTVGSATIKIVADTSEFRAQASSSIRKAAGAASAALAASGIGAAIAGSVISSVDFDTQMREVFTLLPGISGDAMADMQNQVKELSTTYGIHTDDAVPALYDALSAGVPPDNVFAFMADAAELSIGGVADLPLAIDALTSAGNAFGLTATDAERASDALLTAVAGGKTTLPELASSLFNVAPAAAAAGLGLEETLAATAALTAGGVPTATATVQIANAVGELSKTGTVADKAFRDIAGVSFPSFVAAGGTMREALGLISGAASDAGVGVGDFFGSQDAGRAVMALTGNQAETFSGILSDMSSNAGTADAAFETMNASLSRTFERLKARGRVALLNFGETLLPLVERLAALGEEFLPVVRAEVSRLADRVRPFVDQARTLTARVVEWLNASGNLKPVLAGIAAVIGGVLVTSLIAAVAPVAGFVAGIVALGAALGIGIKFLIDFWNENERFRGAVTATAQTIVDVGVHAFQILVDTVNFIVEDVWPRLVTAFDMAVTAVVAIFDVFQTVWPVIREIVTGAWNGISSAITTATATIVPVVQGAIDEIRTIWQGLSFFFDNVIEPAFSALRTVIVDVVIPAIRTAIEVAVPIIETAFGVIKSAVGLLQDAIGLLHDAWGVAVDGIKTAIDVASPLIRSAVSPVTTTVGALNTAIDLLKAAWEIAWPAIRSVLDAAKPAITLAVTAVEVAVQGVKDIVGTLEGTWKRVWNGMKTVIDGAKGGILAAVGGVKEAIQPIIDTVQAIINKVGEAKRALESLNPFSGSETGGFIVEGAGNVVARARADGGLITRPEFALIGEAGPELVLPLNRPRRTAELLAGAGFGGPTVVNNVSYQITALDPHQALVASRSNERRRLAIGIV